MSSLPKNPLPFPLKSLSKLVAGDQWTLPLRLINHSDKDIKGRLTVTLPSNLIPTSELPEVVTVRAGEVKSLPINFVAQAVKGNQRMSLYFKGDGYDDGVSQQIKVIPKGFPVKAAIANSESLEGFSIDFSEAVPQSIEASVKVYNSVMEELTSGLEGMLREPYGCFEQTSSTTYPNILALQLMERTGQADPDVRKSALDKIDKGYKTPAKLPDD